VIVVKLGGSYVMSPLLAGWLSAIGRAAGRVVVVPGGGPFADAVRAAQPVMGFDDAAAHDMALMAMAQFGRGLVSLGRDFVFADSLWSVRDAVGLGRVPVWSPWPMLLGHPDIPQSWEVTSDSLAVWLGAALGASRVVVIKHCAAGSVDAAFAGFVAGFGGSVVMAGPEDVGSAADLFGGRG
jgi:aspartokinase-like uncharacterized kinase